jgi:hypothetical protein
MFIVVSRSDDEGQFLPSVAVELKAFSIYGFHSSGGIVFDVTHKDGEKERMMLKGDLRPFAPMEIGEQKGVQGISIVDYPASQILSKDEWRAMFGVYMLFNGNHFYVPEATA